jgi:hypothetical protein
MKRLLTVLAMMIVPFSKADSRKLGSEADPIRQGLFACQPMNVLVQRLKLDRSSGPFQTFADAAALANSGKKDAAKSRLHSILGLPNLETRIQLWVWSALRELGERPDSRGYCIQHSASFAGNLGLVSFPTDCSCPPARVTRLYVHAAF